MQLIFETETTLNMEPNMSKVEDKNNKMESLDIEDTNDKKNNLNNDVIKIDKDEIAEIVVNMPNNAENIHSDLSGKYNEPNTIETNILQEDELKNDDSIVELTPGNEINHLDIIEQQNESKIEDVSEEDYLEDDIISIRQESFHELGSKKHLETLLTKENESFLDETQHGEDSNMNIDEKAKEVPNEIVDTLSTKVEDDLIEVMDETKLSTAQYEKEVESLIIDETGPSSHCKSNVEHKEEGNVLVETNVVTEEQILVETEVTLISPVKQSTEDKHNDSQVIEVNEFYVHCNNNSEFSIQNSDIADEIQEISSPDKLSSANEEKNSFKTDVNPTIVSVQCEKEVNSANLEVISKECLTMTDLKEIDNSEEAHIENLSKDNMDSTVIKEDTNIELKEPSMNNESTTEADNSSIGLHYEIDVRKNILSVEDTNTNGQDSNTLVNSSTKVDNSLNELQYEMEVEEINENTSRDINPKEPVGELKGNTEVYNSTIEHKMDVEKAVENISGEKASITDVKKDVIKGNAQADKISIELQHDMDVVEIVDNILSNKHVNTVANKSLIEAQENTETDKSLINVQNDIDVEEIIENTSNNKEKLEAVNKSTSINSSPVKISPVSVDNNSNKDKRVICKLSNTLDILSDEEEESSEKVPKVITSLNINTKEKQCINIDDDDDIMLIDEEINKVGKQIQKDTENNDAIIPKKLDTSNTDLETGEKTDPENFNLLDKNDHKETTDAALVVKDSKTEISINEKSKENTIEKPKNFSPLIPDNFVKTAKTKFAEMSREDLEEFCVLKIVESIVDRSSLSDINNKLKEMTQGLEDYRKKTMMLAKQNRDLQVVLKSVQEEQKKATAGTPITPLKITRSVGVQVFMDKTLPRKKVLQQNVNNKNINTPQTRNTNPSVRSPCPPKPANQNIPVPRLVPANNPTLKAPSTISQVNQTCAPNKNTNPVNGVIRNPSPALKADKRPHNKIASSETVDLTDDEPPAKMPGGPKSSTAPPVRVVPPQTLMPPQRQPFVPNVSSPRKVFIPISAQGNQALRPGQTIMLKTIPAAGMRPRCPTPQRVESNAMRINRVTARHPAPLPLAMKQYQPPNWKALPPSPDLKLSKVENGIVISWKIEAVPEDSYEEIASYQLFAYQETSLPPNTALWKKIGDVKALPLPMACTLTQFMAGYKYYFAVRAVDIRSRLGPFSLPGSIMLINKNILD